MVEKNTIGRIAYILNELYKNGFFTRSGLDNHLQNTSKERISNRTFKRAVEDIRHNFGFDLVYVKKDNKYIINEKPDTAERTDNFIDKFSKIKRIPAKNHELMIFYSFVKSMIFSEYYFPPMDNKGAEGDVRDYEHILRIIEGILKEELSEKDIKLAGRIEYHLSEHYKVTQKNKFNSMLNKLLDAMRFENLVRFNYRDTEVYVEPIKIIHYDGKWYFTGYVAKSTREDNVKKVRTYNLSYIKDNIHLTNVKFTGDEYYAPDYRDSYGISASSNLMNAKIRFYDELAEKMKEILWFDNQKTSVGEDAEKGKYCEFLLPYPVKADFELIGRVLSYGENAEIIEPEELREKWQAVIKRMYDSIK